MQEFPFLKDLIIIQVNNLLVIVIDAHSSQVIVAKT